MYASKCLEKSFWFTVSFLFHCRQSAWSIRSLDLLCRWRRHQAFQGSYNLSKGSITQPNFHFEGSCRLVCYKFYFPLLIIRSLFSYSSILHDLSLLATFLLKLHLKPPILSIVAIVAPDLCALSLINLLAAFLPRLHLKPLTLSIFVIAAPELFTSTFICGLSLR